MDNEQNILHEDKYPKTEATETPSLDSLDGHGQFCLWVNQIGEWYDHQYL